MAFMVSPLGEFIFRFYSAQEIISLPKIVESTSILAPGAEYKCIRSESKHRHTEMR
jgi:hypothetical protein